MIAEQLSGKRIAITGSTGFVGTALVERILRAVPDCTLVLLIRPSKRHDASERARREIFKNNAFDRLRAHHKAAGGETFDEMIDRRVHAIAGDVSRDGLGLNDTDRATLATCDIVIHSAAAVSFDSPLDSAVEINLLGPVRIADTLNALGVHPHLAPARLRAADHRVGEAVPVEVRARPIPGEQIPKRGEGARRPEPGMKADPLHDPKMRPHQPPPIAITHGDLEWRIRRSAGGHLMQQSCGRNPA